MQLNNLLKIITMKNKRMSDYDCISDFLEDLALNKEALCTFDYHIFLHKDKKYKVPFRLRHMAGRPYGYDTPEETLAA